MAGLDVPSRFVVITASFALTLGMLWGPFTQNLIRYESANISIDGGLALVGRSVEYDGHGMPSDSNSRLQLCGLRGAYGRPRPRLTGGCAS